MCEVGPERFMSILKARDKALVDKWQTEMVITGCQQCVRTMDTRARRQKIDLTVKDLTEIVVEAMSTLTHTIPVLQERKHPSL